MPSQLHVVGFAIISANGMIADAGGSMPPQIINEADQRFFCDGLDAADVIVHGRNSQEPHPQAPQRLRLVVTRRVPALAPHADNPKALLWNPEGATLDAACAAHGIDAGVVAVIGGPNVFGLFLPRYDVFHLTRAEHAQVPGGRPVFPGIPPLAPEDLLQRHGLRPGPEQALDADAGITLCTWHR